MVVLGAMAVQLDHWDFLLVEFLSPRRFRGSVRSCCVGSWFLPDCFKAFCRAGQGPSRAPWSPGALSLLLICRVAQGSFQLVVADHWLHVLFTRALACFRVQDVGTVLAHNFAAFSFIQNLQRLGRSLSPP